MRALIALAVMGVTLVGASATANAHDRWHRWGYHHGYYAYPAWGVRYYGYAPPPRYYYAPPPVAYYGPEPYYYSAPSFSVTVPLR